MIKTSLSVFAFAFLSLTNFGASFRNAKERCSDCPGFNYLTQGIFNSDFAYCMMNPDASLLSIERIDYFYNLYDYSPDNTHGSCGYVSFIQYLSYYDCFYNDSIISEGYERNQGPASSLSQARAISPGVLKQAYPNSPSSLYSFIQNNKSNDYQMYLMDIVNQSMGHTQSEYSYSIGMWNYYRIIDSISAFDDTSFSYTRVQDFGNNAKPTDANVISWFDSYVKNQLDYGNPVMLHIAQYDSNTGDYVNYHSIVAYYYDENGIHANFGWGSNSTDVVIPCSYQITEAGVIDFDDVAETHSNNFIVANGGRYCGCGLHTVHYYHDHYATYSSLQHVAYCTCGLSTLEVHAADYSRAYTFHGHMYAPCLYCGTVIDLGGGGGPIIPIPGSISQIMVTDNGSYIMPNGIYVIVEEDLEAYLNGTLVFHPYGEEIE